jgi:hypothetical protein
MDRTATGIDSTINETNNDLFWSAKDHITHQVIFT